MNERRITFKGLNGTFKQEPKQIYKMERESDDKKKIKILGKILK